MRMSCNGCRVLRKGCSENCSIRPCLQWIKSPESQSNATLFLAKFYGRAGLLNLINAGPEHLRPAIFRSLLYEAAGRIINPIYGSVGLIWSGNWHLCQNAVDCVLKGSPITPIATDEVALPTKGYDIRHVIKDENSNSADSNILNRVKLNRTRFKRSGLVKPKAVKLVARPALMAELASDGAEPNSSTSHGSAVSHPEGADTDSMVSVEMSEAVARADENGEAVARADGEADEDVGEVDLELTLGFEPVGAVVARGSDPRRKCTWDARVGSLHAMGLGLEL